MVLKYEILDAARKLRALINDADDTTLNAAYQVVANASNDSVYASSHEPWSGLAVAFQAEFRRRALAVHECVTSTRGDFCETCGDTLA